MARVFFFLKGLSMRTRLCAVLLVVFMLAGCGRRPAAPAAPAVPHAAAASGAASVDAGVRAMMGSIAHDVTQGGPAAWLKYFSATPAFFMASEGSLAFPDIVSATNTTRELATRIKHIDLDWGKDLRVDPLTPNLAVVATPWHEVLLYTKGQRVEEWGYFTAVAEYREERWQLRDAHWSVTPARGK